ncbi:MAG: hypothetical protein ACE367_01955 [Acidimicrobiales bacterium]
MSRPHARRSYGEARSAPSGYPLETRRPAISTWRRIETITRQLELCGVVTGEDVVLVTDARVDGAVVDVFVAVGERMGASLTRVVPPDGPTHREDPVSAPAVKAALTCAALVIDLTGTVAGSAVCEDVLDSGRLLSIDADTTADLDALVAHPGLTRRLEQASELLDAGASAVLSSEAGTILDIGLTGAAHRAPAVVAAVAGEQAAWPGGAVWVQPRADIVNGTVIVMPGDVLVGPGTTVRSPVRLEVSGARVVDILGENADADLVRFELEQLDPEKPCRIAEVGFGLSVERRTVTAGPRVREGAIVREAGRCSLTMRGPGAGAGLTVALHGASFAVDHLDVLVDGELIGSVAPDVYELAAAD